MNQFIGLDIEGLLLDGQHVLVLSGELEIASVPALEAAISRLRDGGEGGVTLDLSKLLFIDSTGVAAIIMIGKLCERDGRDFSLIPGPRAIQRIFELTGLIDVLPFRERDSSNGLTLT